MFIYLILSNKIPVQTWSTRVNVPVISDPANVPVEALLTNEKATQNLSGRVGFYRPLKGSSVNHENDYYKIFKFIKLYIYRCR